MLIAIAVAVSVGAVDGEQPAASIEPPFVAECILAREGLAELDRFLCFDRSLRAAEELLQEHAREHGWNQVIGDPDWVDVDQGVACPAEALDYFELAGTQDTDGEECFFRIELAEALARNGRVEQALELVSRSASAVLTDGSLRGFFEKSGPSICAEAGTRIAAHAGQWERALALSADWTPIGRCNIGIDFENREITGIRARCWVELGRCDLVREETLEWLSNRRQNAELMGLWIECQLRGGHARDIDQALEAILLEAPQESWSSQEARRRWELVSMPESELVPHLNELALVAPGRAVSFIRTLDSALLVDRLSAFDQVEEGMRDPSLAWALVYSGRPEVDAIFHTSPEIEELLQRPIGELPEDRFGLLLWQMHGAWQDANERWRCLTSRR
jgi:hypothetical protein